MKIFKNLQSLILATLLPIIISCNLFDSSGISDKEIKTASKFYRAEEYHQKYFEKNF